MAVWFFFVCLVFIPNLLNEVYADPAGDDRDALLAFKAATNINSMECIDASAKWEERDDNSCNWGHVKCDSDYRVQRMNIYNNRLNGVIPPELGNLTSLKVLQLYGNFIEGSIPNELVNLKKLEILQLNDNELSGTVSQEFIDNLPSIKNVDLTNNKELTGPCTESPCGCPC